MSSRVQSHNHVQATVDGHTARDESNVCSNEKIAALIELSPLYCRGMLAGRTKITPSRGPVPNVPIPTYRVDTLDQACNLGPDNEHGCPHIARSCSLGQSATIHSTGKLRTQRLWKRYGDQQCPKACANNEEDIGNAIHFLMKCSMPTASG